MITIRNLSKIFTAAGDSVRAVDGVDLDVGEKEFFVLLGLSGSGKTTLLRCVAGLENPDGGEIGINDALVSSAERRLFVSPENRGVGMVFQSYAVWPHMTVFDNVAFPLLNGPQRMPRAEVRNKVARAGDGAARRTRRSAGALPERRPATTGGAGAGPGG